MSEFTDIKANDAAVHAEAREIGRCTTCIVKRDKCPFPKRLTYYPEKGCSLWQGPEVADAREMPSYDEAELDAAIEKGTKAWAGVDPRDLRKDPALIQAEKRVAELEDAMRIMSQSIATQRDVNLTLAHAAQCRIDKALASLKKDLDTLALEDNGDYSKYPTSEGQFHVLRTIGMLTNLKEILQ